MNIISIHICCEICVFWAGKAVKGKDFKELSKNVDVDKLFDLVMGKRVYQYW